MLEEGHQLLLINMIKEAFYIRFYDVVDGLGFNALA